MLTRNTMISAAIITLGVQAVPISWADDNDEIPFDVAEIFFELNHTDGDLGIHALIDGDPWKKIEIEDPYERKMLNMKVKGRLRRQGLTELFFESAEPNFDELSPEVFFKRFPEGIYEVEGETLDGEELESETELTHTMPAPPVPTVNGTLMAEVCDEDDPDYDAVEVTPPITIEWPAVTMSHPDLGTQPPVEVEINNYQVVLEVEVEIDGETVESVFSVTLPPGETSMTIPEEFIALGDAFKYEVLAREISYNQTAVESCFLLDD